MHTAHRCSACRNTRPKGDGRPIRRPSLKKATAEKILPQVRGIVSGMKTSGNTFLRKEDIARELNVHVRYVEQCLHVLNREGIVSRARHCGAHDSTRDPWGGWLSGWSADTYDIK